LLHSDSLSFTGFPQTSNYRAVLLWQLLTRKALSSRHHW
jgi:hypothetical protein